MKLNYVDIGGMVEKIVDDAREEGVFIKTIYDLYEHLENNFSKDIDIVETTSTQTVEQANKYQELEKAWHEGQKEDTIIFLRKCKEIIEDFEMPKRKRRY